MNSLMEGADSLLDLLTVWFLGVGGGHDHA